MPTTARLVAALLLAALGWGAAMLAMKYMPEGMPVGMLSPVSAAWGAVIGWVWLGRKVEHGRSGAIGLGIAAVTLAVIAVLLTFSLYEMLHRAMRVRYHGPVEGLQDMVAIAVGYGRDVAKPDVILAIFLGGAVIGAIAGWVARRYR